MIRARDLTYAYPGGGGADRPALQLQGVSVALYPGELVLLLGPNASGKSTLAKLFNGLLIPQTGSVTVDGLDTRDPANRRKVRRRVGLLMQHPENQIVAQTVAEDVAFGLENLNLPPPQIRRRVREALERVGLQGFAQRPPEALSGGQLQRLALAGLLAVRPRYLLIDEPFTWVDPPTQRALFGLLLELKAQGQGLLLISQEADLLEYADRVWLMKDGRLLADAPPRRLISRPIRIGGGEEAFRRAGLIAPPLVRLFHRLAARLPEPDPDATPLNAEEMGRWLRPYINRPPQEPKATSARIPHAYALRADRPLLATEGLSFRYDYDYDAGPATGGEALRGVDLSLAPGAWHVLSGPSGSGKSTLAQHLNGLLHPQRGRVVLREEDVTRWPSARLCRHVGLVFQSPREQFFAPTAAEEIGFALRERGLAPEAVSRRVQAVLDRLHLELPLDRPAHAFSGGEQVQIALATALALEPEVLILDETLASLDPQVRLHLLDTLGELVAFGLTVLVISHRPEPFLPCADELAWMDGGRLRVLGPPSALFEAEVPFDLPPLTRLLRTLLPGHPPVFTVEHAYEALCPHLPAPPPLPGGLPQGEGARARS